MAGLAFCARAFTCRGTVGPVAALCVSPGASCGAADNGKTPLSEFLFLSTDDYGKKLQCFKWSDGNWETFPVDDDVSVAAVRRGVLRRSLSSFVVVVMFVVVVEVVVVFVAVIAFVVFVVVVVAFVVRLAVAVVCL